MSVSCSRCSLSDLFALKISKTAVCVACRVKFWSYVAMKRVLSFLQPDMGAGKGKSGKVSATPGVSLCSCTSGHPIH